MSQQFFSLGNIQTIVVPKLIRSQKLTLHFGHVPNLVVSRSATPLTAHEIWANQPIHSFLVGYLNPCFQGTSIHVVSPQPCCTWHTPCLLMCALFQTLEFLHLFAPFPPNQLHIHVCQVKTRESLRSWSWPS